MLAIRLQRNGRSHYPVYRIVVQEAHRHPLSGRVVAEVGNYNPHTKSITLDRESIKKYLSCGAQPSSRVARIFTANGIELHHLRMITGEHIGVVPDEALYVHLREHHPGDAVVVNTGSQRAVYAIAKNPLCMVSTDTGAYLPGEGHPQIAGSFPRFLREMVIERAELCWEEAMVHMTSWPAQVLGLEKKGRMRKGCDADLVILNPETLHDRAEFPGLGKPNAAPEGIDYVIVGGEIAAKDASATGVMAGRAIRM